MNDDTPVTSTTPSTTIPSITPATFGPLPPLLRLPVVLAMVGVNKSTLYRWARAGQFPKARPLTSSGSTVAWSAAEVTAWIAGKLAGCDGTSDGTSQMSAAQAA